MVVVRAYSTDYSSKAIYLYSGDFLSYATSISAVDGEKVGLKLGQEVILAGTKTTDKDGVVVFTYELDIKKYDGADTNKAYLAGAEFYLKNSAGKFLAIDADGKGLTAVTHTIAMNLVLADTTLEIKHANYLRKDNEAVR